MNSDQRLLSVFQAEQMTGRKAATWRRDIFERRIAYVKIGRQVRIPLSEVERLINEGWRESLSDKTLSIGPKR